MSNVKKKPRIAYFSSELIIHDDRFLEKLSKNGYETFLLTIKRKIPESVYKIPGITIINLFHRVFPYDDPADPNYTLKTRVRIKLGFLYYAFLLKYHLRRIDPDILHAGWVPTDGYLASLTKFHPFLLMPWYGDIVHVPFEWSSSRRRAIRALRSADAITCDADIIVEKMKILEPNVASKKIVQFPWGIDLKKFYPSRKKPGQEKTLKVVCVKFLRERAGFKILSEVMAALKSKNIPVEVHVYGDGKLLKVYREETKKRGLENTLFWHGFVNNDEIPELLRQSDVYLSTSLGDGTSLALMEAMACGLPLVVTDIPAHHQWIKHGENGFIFPQNDVGKLVEQLEYLAKDRGKLAAMGSINAQIALKEFDWDINFKKLEQLYQDLLNT